MDLLFVVLLQITGAVLLIIFLRWKFGCSRISSYLCLRIWKQLNRWKCTGSQERCVIKKLQKWSVEPTPWFSCDKEAGELLFNHLSLRAEDRSTIITTNLAFDRWGEIIRDKVLVAAMVDRLTHNAHLINMNGQSYRLKETKAFNEQKQNEKWTFLEFSLQRQDFCDIFAPA